MNDHKIQEDFFKLIQEVISNNPVIVIGSGASVSYGIPSMWDLAETLKEYFKGSTFEDDKRTQVVAKFLKCLDEGMGLEDALLEVKMPQDIEQIIAIEVWKKIACADRKVYDRFVQGEIINLKSLFEYIVYYDSNKIVNIITTNYDKIAEYAAAQTDSYINNGFTHGLKGRLKDNPIAVPRKREDDYTGVLNIIKVHGSLDWFKKDGITYCFPNTHIIPDNYQPCIITPGTNKYEKTQDEPYRQLLSLVDDMFSKATGFLCIGYGFNDSHVHPMLLKYAKTRKVKILIVTKDLTSSINQNIINHGYDYISITSNGKDGTLFSRDKESFEVENKKYWTIDGLEEIYR